MTLLARSGRLAAIAVSVLFIGLSVAGIFGVWYVDSVASDVVVKGYGLIETGVGVAQAGVGRAATLVESSRTEVRQAAATITAVGLRAQENSPVLTALNDRLETRLAPRLANLQQTLAPVRDAVTSVSSAVSFANSIPLLHDRAPRLDALDQTFTRLEELGADSTQLRATLRGLVVERKNELTAETVASLNQITQRIDTRLGEVQTNVAGVQADIVALQQRMEARKSRLLSIFNLSALLVTLMFAWILYTQVVVIQHHWALYRAGTDAPTGADEPLSSAG